jgi:hypothetical protein
MYQFDQNLRDFAAKQDAFLTNLMTKRGLLPIEDTFTSATFEHYWSCKITD